MPSERLMLQTASVSLQTEHRRIAETPAHQFRAVGHVDDGSRIGSAPAAVNYQIDGVFQTLADFIRVGQWFAVFGQHQGAA